MSQIFLNLSEPTKVYNGPVLFSSGHRPFFLFAALSALLNLVLWSAALSGALSLSALWHGHEMIFGFVGAAIAGFLMAAVPKWTNAPNFAGRPVMILASFWVLGRIAFLVAEFFPNLSLLLYLDLLFFPTLTFMIGKLILKAKNKRNYVVIGILSALGVCNLAFMVADPVSALHGAIYIIMMIASLISGRIIPAFTQNALRLQTGREISCHSPNWTNPALLFSIGGLAILEVFSLNANLSALFSGVAGLILAYRMIGWHSLKTYRDPLVWVLHAAHIWLPIGFLLYPVTLYTDFLNATAALHALTAGGMGLLILAVASRAALGHSGRSLKASRACTLAYILIFTAVTCRVFFPDILTPVSGGLWILGFILFAYEYVPILTKPRIDGLPG